MFLKSILLPLLFATSVFAAAYDQRPVPKVAPLPEYPAELRQKQIEGTVLVEVTIDEKGKVTEATVIKSSDEGFNQTTVDTVKSMWRWTPAKKEGKEVACTVRIPLRFSLTD